MADDKIDRALELISEEHGIQILYARESGSCAWGFESADSDEVSASQVLN